DRDAAQAVVVPGNHHRGRSPQAIPHRGGARRLRGWGLAVTRSCEAISSQSSSTTAVWDRLWGSTPMMVAGHNHGLRRVSIENVTVAIGLLLDRRWRLVA
ncbi:MAG: hypothetical protein M3423_09160, partial [Actinomycetota bacterium]|nr:hypothetical protein [Actinomycetota bacterium]